MSLVLDTHALVWYLSDSPKLSSKARSRIENAEHSAEGMFASAISLVEIVYLGELNRIPPEAVSQLFDVLKDSTGSIVVAPLDSAIATTVQRISRQDVPEMPDRIIAATAVHLSAELVTRDRRLQAAGIQTLW